MKSIKKNFIYSVIYQILLVILPLITAPYISRKLGAENLGIYSYTYSIANYFLLFAMLGIANHGNRSIATCKDNFQKRSEIFTSIYLIQLILFVFSIASYVFYSLIMVNENHLITYLQIIYLISGLLDIIWLYFGVEDFKFTVIRNVLIKLVTVILIFIFVRSVNDLWLYTLIMASGAFISQAYLWIRAKRYVSFTRIKLELVKKQILPILILFIPVLAYSLYKFMDKIMLGNMCDYSEVGMYNNAEKIINIPLGIITALGTVMLPRMSSLLQNGDNQTAKSYIRISTKFVTIVATCVAFGLIGISTVFSPVFFGDGFDKCPQLIMILSITVFFISWANVIRTQILIPKKRDIVYVISTIVGAVVNLVLNYVLIPRLQSIGAAIATVGAEGTVFLIQCVWIEKDEPIMIYILKYIPILLIGVLMAVCVYFVGFILEQSIFTLIIQVLVGVLISIPLIVLYLYFVRDELSIFITKGLKKAKKLFFTEEKNNDVLFSKFSNKLSFVYLLLSFFVIFLHASSDFISSNIIVNSIQEFFYRICDVSVSMFFLISAFMFFRNISKRKYLNSLKNKTLSLLFPFIVWNVIMFVMKYIKFSRNGTLYDEMDLSFWGIINGFIYSNYNPVLWFLLDLYIIYLIWPIFYFLLKNKYVGILTIIVSIALNIAFANEIGYSWLCYWIPSFLIGAFIALHYKKYFSCSFLFIPKNRVMKSVCYCSLGVLFLLLCYFGKTNKYMEFIYRLLTPLILWYLIDLIKLPYIYKEVQNSFIVYCSQIAFISLLNGILLHFQYNEFTFIIPWILSPCILFISIDVIGIILRKNRYIWFILTGSLQERVLSKKYYLW